MQGFHGMQSFHVLWPSGGQSRAGLLRGCRQPGPHRRASCQDRVQLRRRKQPRSHPAGRCL